MRHFYSITFITVLASLLFTPSLFGDVTIDDFEYVYSCSWIGTYWYVWSDENSTITGDYGPGNASDSAGQFDFTVTSGAQYAMAYKGISFDNAAGPVNCTGATSVTFDIKASRNMTIILVVSQSTIADSITAMYYRQFNVTPAWNSITVNLSEGAGALSKLWGGDAAFAIDKLTGLSWAYAPYYNPTDKYLPGTVWIDNVEIIGNPTGLQPPFSPFIWGAVMNNPISPTVVWYPSVGATSYGLQLSTTYGFDSYLVDLANLTDTTYTISSPTLTPGTLYYWRVNASDGGNTSRWSWIGIFRFFTVSYDGNGSSGGTVPVSANYIQGTTVTVSANTGNLTRTGYIFAGWNTAADGSGTGYAAGATFTMDTSNVTIYAQWVPTHTVTYNGNGNTSGSAPTDGNAYQQGAQVTVLGNTGSLVKAGMAFAGWNTAVDGSGTGYAAGATFTMGTSDVTLYARWVPIYTVTYNGNGNTSGSAPTDGNSYQQGVTVTVLGNTGSLVKTGSTFAGWNTAADGSGTSYAGGAAFTMGTSDVTLYAQWTSNPTYSVTYNGNGNTSGSLPADPNNYLQGATVTVLGNTGSLVKTSMAFAGWNTAANGSGTGYAAGATFAMGTANVTLYAQWTPTCTVAYNGNGNNSGTVPTDGNTYLQGATVTVLGNTGSLVKTGYTFAGWNTAANGTGTGYAAGATFTMGTANVTLYAQWTLVPIYTVTYNGNVNTGGTVPVDGNHYIQGATVTVSGNTGSLAKAGYTFSGWNTAADGSGTGYAADETFAMGPANIVLYAQWSLNSYTLTVKRLSYRLFGWTAAEKINDTVVTHGDTVSVTAVTGSAAAGCSFIEWRVTAGEALLIDSTQSTCRVILSNGNAEITAHDICPVSADNVVKDIPTRFGLSCNGKTGTIVFAIPKVTGFSSVPVSIRLFDIQGQLLGIVADRTMIPGYYTANIGIRAKMAMGMVICRMESVGYRSVVKIIAR